MAHVENGVIVHHVRTVTDLQRCFIPGSMFARLAWATLLHTGVYTFTVEHQRYRLVLEANA